MVVVIDMTVDYRRMVLKVLIVLISVACTFSLCSSDLLTGDP